jgi:hypothetical protein
MNNYRMNAILVGALFSLTMIAGFVETKIAAPLLQGPLSAVFQQDALLKTGALLILFMATGIVGIAILLFPVIRTRNETVAVTYLAFRIIECVLLIVGSVVSLVLAPLCAKFVTSSTPNPAWLQAIVAMAVNVRYSAFQIAMVLLGVGSLLVFATFYRSELIPRWLSAWGLIGYALLLASALLSILGLVDTVSGMGMILYIPGGVFELFAFPIWLIAKGFCTVAAGPEEYST